MTIQLHEKPCPNEVEPLELLQENAAVDRAVARANDYLQSGDVEQALCLINSSRTTYPDNFALCIAAATLHQSRADYAGALADYLQAVQLDSHADAALRGVAVCLQNLERYSEAEFWYRQILDLRPNQTDAALNLAFLLSRRNAWDAAELVLRRCIDQTSDQPDLSFCLAYILEQKGRTEEAIELYRNILISDPTHAEAASNLANALYQQSSYHEAIALIDQLLPLNKAQTALLIVRGNCKLSLSQYQAALSDYEAALSLDPTLSEAHCNRGAVLEKLDRMSEAQQALEKSVDLDPQNAGAWNNLGNVFAAQGEVKAAHAAFIKSLTLRPDDPDTLANFANCIDALGEPDAAMAHFNKALELHPSHIGAHWNKGLSLLRQGEFEKGWPLYEWRFRAHDVVSNRKHQPPRWRAGQPLNGKTLAIRWEQGLGDTIQFSRFVHRLAEAGGQILFEPQPALRKLMSSLQGSFSLVTEAEAEQADFHLPLMSIPFEMGFSQSDLGIIHPYLNAEKHRPEGVWWDRLMAFSERPLIAICWQGSLTRIDRGRSIPFEFFEELAQHHREFQFVSVQKGPAAEQLNSRKDSLILNLGETFDSGADAFCDTAVVLSQSALLLTVDTSVAHLAGAIGCATWTLLQHHPDWRWMRERTDTPWYPSMTLFRQRKSGDWTGVFAQISQELSILSNDLA